MGIIVEYLAFEGKPVCYLDYNCSFNNTLAIKTGTWSSKAFKIFGSGWVDFVLSLPASIPLSVKLKCVKDHDKYTHLFGWRNLISFKGNHYFDIKVLISEFQYLRLFINGSLLKLFAILLIPSWLINIARKRFNRK